MFAQSVIQIIVPAMSLVMQGVTAVLTHQHFVFVSPVQLNYYCYNNNIACDLNICYNLYTFCN